MNVANTQERNMPSSSHGKTTTIMHANETVEKRTGTAAFRNNNPGNIRPGNFADQHDAIGIDLAPSPGCGPWAVFENSEAGYAALTALLNTASVGNRTIEAEMRRYAPLMGDNPVGYASMIARKLGVPVTTKVSALTPEQKEIMRRLS
jgi:hypothetical protein